MSQFLASNYGGKKGFVIAQYHRLLGVLGSYRAFQLNDFDRVTRLVFVCQGNICRSPFAEYYARSLGLNASSFGLEATTGAQANEVATEVALKMCVDMSSHEATNAKQFTVLDGDLLIGFEPVQSIRLKQLITASSGAQVSLAGLWLKPSLPYIHDPYGNPVEYFYHCYLRITKIIEHLDALLPNCRSSR